MRKDIVYLGDTSLDGAASYLAGVMSYYGIGYEYLATNCEFNSDLLSSHCQAIIISDYPAKNFNQEQLYEVASTIRNGTGLLMIGGWESFTGLGGGYNQTVLKDVLPVIMSDEDDRINYSGCCLVEKNCEHKIVSELPFAENPPVIGGFNCFAAKPESSIIVSAKTYGASYCNGAFKFTEQQTAPLLVAGKFGNGNTIAFASDVAPHWIGGMVDWGDKRVLAQADGAEQIEVGNWYAEFFANMIRWVCGQENCRQQRR